MASKRRINYQWRLFIPLVVMLWLIIGILVLFQYRREVNYRTESITNQLKSINSRIINAYERDYDLGPFIHFLDLYLGNSTFDDIMVSVYDDAGDLLYRIGYPIMQTDNSDQQTPELAEAEEHGEGKAVRGSILSPEKIFYYSAIKSSDGKLYVHTAMPYTVSLSDALSVDPMMWSMIILLALTTTVIAYISTRYLGRNITLLKEFANRAADNKDFVATDRFTHDELGDISRQIVRIYREKDTALQKSEREHRIALRATEEKARIKRQLTNNINHELKTPIGIIKGYIDTIAETPDMSDAMRDSFIHKAQEHIQRICTLLNDISTITRLDEAGNKIPTTEVDYHDLVYSISNDIETTGINGNLTFSYDIPFDCIVRGNETLLSNMLLNLIRNAAAYSHGTEIKLSLINETAKYYTFSFADNGVGVPQEHIPHLFERFYRVDTGRSRKAGGTGLGLPIVKNTITTLGGTISVRNGAQSGLEFVYTLPKWEQWSE